MWLYFKLALAEFLLRSTGDHFPVIFISWGVMALRMPPPTSLVEVSLCSSAAQHGLPLCHEPLVRDCFSGLGAAQMPSLGNQLHVGTARTSTTTLWIPLTKLQLHLLEDEEWYFTALKISCFNLMYILSSYWLCLSLKKSSHASSRIFSSPLLLLTSKSVQLFGEMTWKVAKLPTIILAPAWKKLLPSQPDSLSQPPQQLLTHT